MGRPLPDLVSINVLVVMLLGMQGSGCKHPENHTAKPTDIQSSARVDSAATIELRDGLTLVKFDYKLYEKSEKNVYVLTNSLTAREYQIDITSLHTIANGEIDPYDPATLLGNAIRWDGDTISDSPQGCEMEQLKYYSPDSMSICIKNADRRYVVFFGTPFYCGGRGCSNLYAVVLYRDKKTSWICTVDTGICDKSRVLNMIVEDYRRHQTLRIPHWSGTCFKDSVQVKDVKWIEINR